MSDYCVILTTFASREQARPVIDRVLEEKLAACVQTTPIESHYFWDGAICHDDEILALFKTRTDLWEPLRALIEAMHPYETPELIRLPIEEGAAAYLAWIGAVTGQG